MRCGSREALGRSAEREPRLICAGSRNEDASRARNFRGRTGLVVVVSASNNLRRLLVLVAFAGVGLPGCGPNPSDEPLPAGDAAVGGALDLGVGSGPTGDLGLVDGGAHDAGTEPIPSDAGGPGCLQLTFSAGFNGRIEGEAEQCVSSEGSSTSVEAVPRRGFSFRAWSDGRTENPRVISQPQRDLSLKAEFDTDGLTTVWLGHSFIRWNVELLFDVARSDVGYGQHEDWMTFSGGAGGAPGSLWADPQRREFGQAMIRDQQPDNVVLTYHFQPGSSDYDDYANWVDYTLEHAPNARFYISLPWRSSPFGSGQFAPIIDQNGGDDLARPYVEELLPEFDRAVLSRLRANYPDHEFVIIPQAIAADRITKAHFAGTLTYGGGSALFIRNPQTGAPDEHEQSIYDDGTGHPGGPLRLLTMMLYLRYIYGVETDSYDFWEDKESFSNAGLEGVPPKETFDVPYRYYHGFDFPAVADEIFDLYGRGP